MEWISVKDKYPEDIVGLRTLVTDGIEVYIAEWQPWEEDRWAWILPKAIKKVKYWAPLPKPPGSM